MATGIDLNVAILADAINNKKIVTFIYKDEVRVVEPHALGVNGRLRAFQIYPVDETRPGWRMFDVDKIKPAQFTAPRIGYVKGDKQMPEGILAQL